MAWRVQAGAGEEAGTWRVDQRAWTLVHLLAVLLSAVKASLLTYTVKDNKRVSKIRCDII